MYMTYEIESSRPCNPDEVELVASLAAADAGRHATRARSSETDATQPDRDEAKRVAFSEVAPSPLSMMQSNPIVT